MKKLYMIVAGICLLGLVAPTPSFAGKRGKNKGGTVTVPSDVYAKYDKNGNGKLDDDEKDALKKDYEKEKDGPLKACDANSDGKLSDEEIAAIPATKPGDAPVKKKKKNKNQ